MDQKIEIRLLSPEGFEDTLKLFNSVFKREESFDFWENKHRKNPFGESVFFGGYDGDRLVAMSAFMKTEYTDSDKLYKVLLTCESAVDERYRNRGLYRAILSAAQEWAAENGFDFMMGFPNPNSYTALIKNGWKDISHADSWGLINHFCRWISSAEKERPVANAYLLLNHLKNLLIPDRGKNIEILEISSYEFIDSIDRSGGLRFRYTKDLIDWKIGSDGRIYRVLKGDDTAAVIAVTGGRVSYIDIKTKDDISWLGSCLKKILSDHPLIDLTVDERIVPGDGLKKAGFVTRRETPHCRVAFGLTDESRREGFFDGMIIQNIEED